MTQTDEMKKAAARAALDYLEEDEIIGIGTGSTANYFMDWLAQLKFRISGAVASSVITATRLKKYGFEVLDLNLVNYLPFYVDGADEATRALQLLKGGGGALTREKIVAAGARKFICIADESKLVDVLGKFPLPIEVIPMARSYVARQIVQMGGEPVYRVGFTTDNGNVILDVHGLDIIDPVKLERDLNQIAGVVSNGLFAQRPADVLLVAGSNGVQSWES